MFKKDLASNNLQWLKCHKTQPTKQTYIYMCVCMCYIYRKVKLATVDKSDLKAPFSVATTPRRRGGRYSFPYFVPFYH